MVTEVPDAAVSNVGRAEDVAFLNDRVQFNDGNSAGDTGGGNNTLTFAQDVEILGLLVDAFYAGEQLDASVAAGGSTINAGIAREQITTRNSFVDISGDLDIPAGIMYWQFAVATPGFLGQDGGDEAFAGGAQGYHVRTFVHPEMIEIESTSEVDEGTDITIRWELQSVPDGEIALQTGATFFHRER